MALRLHFQNSLWLLLFSCSVGQLFLSGEMVYQKDGLVVGGNVTETTPVFLSSAYDKSWCVVKDYAKPDSVQEGLDWACGLGNADCIPIDAGNGCFLPNTVYSHASYAFNSYYQIHGHASGTCDFDGVATVTYMDPRLGKLD